MSRSSRLLAMPTLSCLARLIRYARVLSGARPVTKRLIQEKGFTAVTVNVEGGNGTRNV